MPSSVRRWFSFVVLSLILSLFSSSHAFADSQAGATGDFGVGAMLGAPTGLSLKYWLTDTSAIDGGLAWHFGDDDRFQIHSDYLYHIAIPGFTIPIGRLY